ncbi:hypothetical protein J3R83DRAFT_11624 [Lanmaoa asiatica]|nr:hypothetical protein J3R83DRAFT_11624 [Lanmaoa asiatica]
MDYFPGEDNKHKFVLACILSEEYSSTGRHFEVSFEWDQNRGPKGLEDLTLDDIRPLLVERIRKTRRNAVVHPDCMVFHLASLLLHTCPDSVLTLNLLTKFVSVTQDSSRIFAAFDPAILDELDRATNQRMFTCVRVGQFSVFEQAVGEQIVLVRHAQRPCLILAPQARTKLNDMVGELRALLDTCNTLSSSFCTGACPVASDQCTVVYGKLAHLKTINLSEAAIAELEDLTEACTPATFGRNDEDVYDESYRKAWKMDGGDYITGFNLDDTDIMDTVKSKLLGDDQRQVEAELYKLNVYSQGSFFKPHKDTPRSDRMFGSLVVLFPTPHEGGMFALRHRGEESEIDLSVMISKAPQTPSVGFVAFFSDIDHEVLEITSGYRVALTYNLYFGAETTDTSDVHSITPSLGSHASLLRTAIQDLIEHPGLLLRGGYLAFGLLHQYPVSQQVSVDTLRTCLKGQDAMLARVIDALSLTWYLRMHYDCSIEYNNPDHDHFLSEFIVQFAPNANLQYGSLDNLLPDVEHISVVQETGFPFLDDGFEDAGCQLDRRACLMVTPLPRVAQPVSKFIHYGNDAVAGKLYADVSLIVEVPAKVPGSERKRALTLVYNYTEKDLRVDSVEVPYTRGQRERTRIANLMFVEGLEHIGTEDCNGEEAGWRERMYIVTSVNSSTRSR